METAGGSYEDNLDLQQSVIRMCEMERKNGEEKIW